MAAPLGGPSGSPDGRDQTALVAALGLDFGTSNTVALLRLPDGRTRPLLFDGSPLLPSAVCATPGGLICGRDAQHAARLRPECYEPNPKRRVDEGQVLLGDEQVEVVELFAAVIGRVWTEAQRVRGGGPVAVTLTHPAAWGEQRRGTLLAAAERAGISEPRLVPEPIAAAAHYLAVVRPDIEHGRPVVVYDLGGGTFDASVLEREPGGLRVLASSGLTDAGGLDIDAAIVAYLGASLPDADQTTWTRLMRAETSTDRRANRLLWEDVSAAKEMLSRTSESHIYLPLIERGESLRRQQLELLARPILTRTVAATQHAIRSAGRTQRDIAAVFLVGGSSRMPLVAELLRAALGMDVSAVEQPEQVVADGGILSVGDMPPVVPHDTLPPLATPSTWQTPAGPWVVQPVSAMPVSAPPGAPPPDPAAAEVLTTPSGWSTPLPGHPVSAPPASGPPIPGAAADTPTTPELPVSAPPTSAPPVPDEPAPDAAAAGSVAAAPAPEAPAADAPVSAPPVSAPPALAPPVSAPPVSAPPVSAPPVSAPPVSAPPVSAPPVSAPPISAPPVSAPPVSAPPVSAPPVSAVPASGPPEVPEEDATAQVEPAGPAAVESAALPGEPAADAAQPHPTRPLTPDERAESDEPLTAVPDAPTPTDNGPTLPLGDAPPPAAPPPPFPAPAPFAPVPGPPAVQGPPAVHGPPAVQGLPPVPGLPAVPVEALPPGGKRGSRWVLVGAGALVVAIGVTAAIVALYPRGDDGDAATSAGPAVRTRSAVSYGIADNSGPAPLPVAAAHSGGTLVVQTDLTIPRLDPAVAHAGTELEVGHLIYRSLTALRTNDDGSTTVIGDLAVNPGENTDGACKVWQYTLRPGLRYSDGTAVVAQDVVRGVGRSFNPDLTHGFTVVQRGLTGRGDYSTGWSEGAAPPGVRAVSDSVVEFTFADPHCDAPYAMSLPTTAPVPDLQAGTDFGARPIGAGPYMIDSRSDKAIVLVRNPYWQADSDPLRSAAPDRIEIQTQLSSADIATRLVANAAADQSMLSWGSNAPLRDDELASKLGVRDVTGRFNSPLYLIFNTSRLVDVDVRRAIAQAVDRSRQPAYRATGSEGVEAVPTLIPPGTRGYQPYDDPYPFDPDPAKNLLGGRSPSVTLSMAVSNANNRQQQAQIIKEDLAKVGITVNITVVGRPDALKAAIADPKNTFDLSLLSVTPDWPSGYRLLSELFDGRYDNPENFAQLHDNGVDAEFSRLDAASVEEQNAGAAALDRALLEMAVALPIYNSLGHFPRGSNVDGTLLSAVSGLPCLDNVYLVDPVAAGASPTAGPTGSPDASATP